MMYFLVVGVEGRFWRTSKEALRWDVGYYNYTRIWTNWGLVDSTDRRVRNGRRGRRTFPPTNLLRRICWWHTVSYHPLALISRLVKCHSPHQIASSYNHRGFGIGRQRGLPGAQNHYLLLQLSIQVNGKGKGLTHRIQIETSSASLLFERHLQFLYSYIEGYESTLERDMLTIVNHPYILFFSGTLKGITPKDLKTLATMKVD